MSDFPQQAIGRLPDSSWPSDWLERCKWDTITLLPGAGLQSGARRLLTTSPGGGDPSRHRLRIGSYRRASGIPGQPPELALVASTEVITTGVSTAVELPEADLHLVNDGELTMAAARTDERSLEVMLTEAPGLADVAARATVISTIWDMLGKGEVSAGDALEVLLELLASEPGTELMDPLFSLAVNVAEYWSPTGLVPRRLAKVADVAAQGSDRPEQREASLRALATSASRFEHFAVVDQAAAEDVDLAWRVMTRRASLGRLDPQSVAEMSERDPDSTWRAWAVSAALPTLEAKEEAWARIFESDWAPGSAELAQVARSFWRPVQHSLLAPWAERYLDQIQQLHTDGPGIADPMRDLVQAMMPATCTADWPDRARAMGGTQNLDPEIHRALCSGADLLTRVLRARS